MGKINGTTKSLVRRGLWFSLSHPLYEAGKGSTSDSASVPSQALTPGSFRNSWRHRD